VVADGEFDDLFDEEQVGGELIKSKTADKQRAQSRKVGPNEVAAGDLEASKNTEMGFKQRKVNKRLKSYEEKDDGGEEDDNKKDD
jgi:hypothetical protein